MFIEFNFEKIDIESHALENVRWNYLSDPRYRTSAINAIK